MRVRTALALALWATLSGCTIEGMRTVGQPCQQDRECVTGLVCLPQADNVTVCLARPGAPPVTEAAVAGDASGEGGAAPDVGVTE